MSAFTRAISRAFLSTSSDDDVFKQIVLCCAAGLFVSVLLLTYGIDLSPGFF